MSKLECIIHYLFLVSMRGSRAGQGVQTPLPEKNPKKIGFLSITFPNRLQNHKATKSAFNVWPSSARLKNYSDPHSPHLKITNKTNYQNDNNKKSLSQLDPSGKIFWIRVWYCTGGLCPRCANHNKSRLLFLSAVMFKKPLWQTVWTKIKIKIKIRLLL